MEFIRLLFRSDADRIEYQLFKSHDLLPRARSQAERLLTTLYDSVVPSKDGLKAVDLGAPFLTEPLFAPYGIQGLGLLVREILVIGRISALGIHVLKPRSKKPHAPISAIACPKREHSRIGIANRSSLVANNRMPRRFCRIDRKSVV